MRYWDAAHKDWREQQRAAHGEEAVPPDATASAGTAASTAVDERTSAAILHYVGRDKPWMRYERGRRPDAASDLCRRLREKDDETCARYLETQAMWWRAFGAGRCLVVGGAARALAQGFVIESFEVVLRMHGSLPLKDVGNASRSRSNVACEDAAACATAAAKAGCTDADAVLSLGSESGLPRSIRSLLQDVYRPKLGIFGGPPV